MNFSEWDRGNEDERQDAKELWKTAEIKFKEPIEDKINIDELTSTPTTRVDEHSLANMTRSSIKEFESFEANINNTNINNVELLSSSSSTTDQDDLNNVKQQTS